MHARPGSFPAPLPPGREVLEEIREGANKMREAARAGKPRTLSKDWICFKITFFEEFVLHVLHISLLFEFVLMSLPKK